jgi:hypothetical protein
MSRNYQSVVVAQYVKAALDMSVVSTVEVCDMRCQLPAKFVDNTLGCGIQTQLMALDYKSRVASRSVIPPELLAVPSASAELLTINQQPRILQDSLEKSASSDFQGAPTLPSF